MKIVTLIEQSQRPETLLLFFGGWATDNRVFSEVNSSLYDVVMLYDYHSLDEGVDELKAIVESYESVILCAWSMGVWAASEVINLLGLEQERILASIAINGTLEPVSDRWGIPSKIFEATINNLPDGLPRFNLRMCGSKSEADSYNLRHPQRSESDIKGELISISQAVRRVDSIVWSGAVISSKDMIIPTANQRAFWGEYQSSINREIVINEVEGAHFIFGGVQYWEEIVNSFI